jgi:ribosomal protein L34E
VVNYVSSNGNPAYLLRAIEHLENCIDATYRAVLNAEALRNNNIGRGAPRLTPRQRASLKAVRDAIEHSDERLLRLSRGPLRPWFQQGQPFSLFVTNTKISIGELVLTYRQLVAAITKCHSTIEKIRGVPTGQPATADTTSASGGRISDAFKQSLRASITHA